MIPHREYLFRNMIFLHTRTHIVKIEISVSRKLKYFDAAQLFSCALAPLWLAASKHAPTGIPLSSKVS